MCNTTEQLGWALNAYYEAQDSTNKASACNFNNSATTRATVPATRACTSLPSEAGTVGTGVVTSQPTATTDGGASASKSKGAAAGVHSAFTGGDIYVGSIIALLGLLSGLGMILL